MTRKSIVRSALRGLACVLLACAAAHAQYEPPPGYYSSATASDHTLQGQLRAIIGKDWWNPASTAHRARPYGDARFALQLLDADPADSSMVVLIYSGLTVPGVWDSGVTWNREHTWPVSRGVGTSGPDYSDLHQLRPCNPTVNNARGNNPFGIGPGYWDPQPSTNPWFTGVGSRAFNPETNDRGKMARAMFYMATRYDGTDNNTENLTLVNGMPTGNQMGDLARLLEWHYSDPVGERERLRNHLIFSSADNPSWYQGNRNPFVDRPEFVWAIWGGAPNDSTLFVGDAPDADGGSSEHVVIRLIAGTPDARPFTLSKTGQHPTTYDALASGPFTVVGAGQGRAFVGGVQSEVFWVVPDSVATPGVFTGSVVIDNTDLTSAGPARGSADENDTVMLTCEVLTPSVPSFDAASVQQSVVITGSFPSGTGLRTAAVPLHNAGFGPLQALLDLHAVTGAGGRFSVVSGQASHIGETPAMIVLGFDTAGAPLGPASRQFTVHTSDEDIPGQTAGTLSIIWNITVTPPLCPGDANGDLFVNFTDITSVLANWGQGHGPGDANNDGEVNFADITSVLANWGADCG